MASVFNEFSELLRELRAVKHQIGDASDVLDDAMDRVRRLAKQHTLVPVDVATAGAANAIGDWTDYPDMQTLVKLVKLERQMDGRFQVQIGEEETIAIPESLADLLALLAADAGDYLSVKDPFVGWKSLDSLAEKLGLSGRHAVNARIYRLRRLLALKDLDPKLVQTSPRMGARFGLSGKGVLVIQK